MAQTINTNMSSLTAQRNQSKTQGELSTAINRLSSGLRINSAKDDAAGMAISERMTSQIRGLNQAARNANDGISLAQVAEGGLGSIGGNLQRMRELAVQAANATNSASDRAALQQEVSQLAAEIDRVATQSQFNGLNLLDGTYQSQQYQVGANAGQTITVAGIPSARSSALGQQATASVSGTSGVSGPLLAGDLILNGTAISASVSGTAAGQSAGSAFAIAAAINASQINVVATAATTVSGVAATAAGVIASGTFSINGVAVGATVSGATAAAEGTAVANAINAVSGSTGVSAAADAAGIVTLTAADGRDIAITGTVTNTGLTAATTTGKINLTSTEAGGIVIAGAAPAKAGLIAGSTPIDPLLMTGVFVSAIDVTSVSGANAALASVDAALTTINSNRASLGAIQNRFQSTIENLQTSSENLSASRSRIQDADFAAETAALARAQVLQQAGTAMIAQANQLPQQVLQLLK